MITTPDQLPGIITEANKRDAEQGGLGQNKAGRSVGVDERLQPSFLILWRECAPINLLKWETYLRVNHLQGLNKPFPEE